MIFFFPTNNKMSREILFLVSLTYQLLTSSVLHLLTVHCFCVLLYSKIEEVIIISLIAQRKYHPYYGGFQTSCWLCQYSPIISSHHILVTTGTILLSSFCWFYLYLFQRANAELCIYTRTHIVYINVWTKSIFVLSHHFGEDEKLQRAFRFCSN